MLNLIALITQDLICTWIVKCRVNFSPHPGIGLSIALFTADASVLSTPAGGTATFVDSTSVNSSVINRGASNKKLGNEDALKKEGRGGMIINRKRRRH